MNTNTLRHTHTHTHARLISFQKSRGMLEGDPSSLRACCRGETERTRHLSLPLCFNVLLNVLLGVHDCNLHLCSLNLQNIFTSHSSLSPSFTHLSLSLSLFSNELYWYDKHTLCTVKGFLIIQEAGIYKKTQNCVCVCLCVCVHNWTVEGLCRDVFFLFMQ